MITFVENYCKLNICFWFSGSHQKKKRIFSIFILLERNKFSLIIELKNFSSIYFTKKCSWHMWIKVIHVQGIQRKCMNSVLLRKGWKFHPRLTWTVNETNWCPASDKVYNFTLIKCIITRHQWLCCCHGHKCYYCSKATSFPFSSFSNMLFKWDRTEMIFEYSTYKHTIEHLTSMWVWVDIEIRVYWNKIIYYIFI